MTFLRKRMRVQTSDKKRREGGRNEGKLKASLTFTFKGKPTL